LPSRQPIFDFHTGLEEERFVEMSANSKGEITRVAETGLGRYQVEARVGQAAFLIDEPAEVGGLGSGPNPYNLLSAALGACKTMTIRLYANRKDWPLKHVEVAVRHRRSDLNARDIFDVDVTLQGALDDTQRAKLMEIGGRCPVSITLTRGADVHSVLKPDVSSLSQPVEDVAHMKCMEETCAD
jgi:putative redox protein